jgi:nucleoside-diphosphate-sugar epimerase
MKVLVIGGSGLIGGDAALHLADRGHDVTIMSRRPPTAPALAELDFLQGDYVHDDMADGRLRGFDWLVFAAAADIRNLPRDGSVDPATFYREANDIAVPRCLEAARDAGVNRVVYIGSFYTQVARHRIDLCPYVASRDRTDRAVRALSGPGFTVCALDCPFVLGHIPGSRVPYIAALASYARGQLEGAPVFAPAGGTNHISSRSVAEAVRGALEQGEGGRAYLVGDQNYSWKAYLELWFEEAGNPVELEVRSDDHPLFPDAIMFAGPGATVAYEVPEAEHRLLGNYARQQIPQTIREILSAYPAGDPA